MPNPPTRDPGALPRRIGFWSAVAIVIGSTIGSGIFRTPAGVADRIPGPLPLIAVWIVAGIFALCGALTLAEVASILPRTGGFYAFLRDGWSRLLGFLFGWSQLVMVRAFALGAIAITFSEYLLRVLGFDPTVPPYDRTAHYIAAIAIVVTATFNIIGVRWGSLVTNLTTIGKFAGLSFVIVIALLMGLPQTGGNFTPATPPGSFALGAFGLALVSVLWAYDGWGDLSYVAGEVQEPQRNLPRALIGGTIAVMVIYVLANLAYLAVLPVEQIRVSKLVAADVAQAVIGRPGAVIVSATVMVSTFGTLSAVLLTTPRILFAMADDGLLFRPIAAVHPRYETPFMAIGLVATLGAIFVLFFPFEQLADFFVTAMIPFYALGVAAVFRLRRRGAVSPYRTPGYPIVPLLFIASVVYLMINGLIAPEARRNTAIIFGVILLGVPVYYLIERRRRPPAAVA
ncbi:MAG TPA: amino acid permease [Gemmatimonadaceae bacterium]|nr:amino acid permease [Gemmatimonadaceae bacterium]